MEQNKMRDLKVSKSSLLATRPIFRNLNDRKILLGRKKKCAVPEKITQEFGVNFVSEIMEVDKKNDMSSFYIEILENTIIYFSFNILIQDLDIYSKFMSIRIEFIEENFPEIFERQNNTDLKNKYSYELEEIFNSQAYAFIENIKQIIKMDKTELGIKSQDFIDSIRNKKKITNLINFERLIKILIEKFQNKALIENTQYNYLINEEMEKYGLSSNYFLQRPILKNKFLDDIFYKAFESNLDFLYCHYLNKTIFENYSDKKEIKINLFANFIENNLSDQSHKRFSIFSAIPCFITDEINHYTKEIKNLIDISDFKVNQIHLTGPVGGGKSHFILNLYNFLRSETSNYRVFYVYLDKSNLFYKQKTCFKSFLRDFYLDIISSPELLKELEIDFSDKKKEIEYILKVIDFVQISKKNVKIILIIDQYNDLQYMDDSVKFLIETVEKKIRICGYIIYSSSANDQTVHYIIEKKDIFLLQNFFELEDLIKIIKIKYFIEYTLISIDNITKNDFYSCLNNYKKQKRDYKNPENAISIMYGKSENTNSIFPRNICLDLNENILQKSPKDLYILFIERLFNEKLKINFLLNLSSCIPFNIHKLLIDIEQNEFENTIENFINEELNFLKERANKFIRLGIVKKCQFYSLLDKIIDNIPINFCDLKNYLDENVLDLNIFMLTKDYEDSYLIQSYYSNAKIFLRNYLSDIFINERFSPSIGMFKSLYSYTTSPSAKGDLFQQYFFTYLEEKKYLRISKEIEINIIQVLRYKKFNDLVDSSKYHGDSIYRYAFQNIKDKHSHKNNLELGILFISSEGMPYVDGMIWIYNPKYDDFHFDILFIQTTISKTHKPSNLELINDNYFFNFFTLNKTNKFYFAWVFPLISNEIKEKEDYIQSIQLNIGKSGISYTYTFALFISSNGEYECINLEPLGKDKKNLKKCKNIK